MRSFNRDRRIFCALLYTQPCHRCGLVEADAVVFYDHGLNPVMDAKAQEWCDRIGARRTCTYTGEVAASGAARGGCSNLLRVFPFLQVGSPSCYPVCSFCTLSLAWDIVDLLAVVTGFAAETQVLSFLTCTYYISSDL